MKNTATNSVITLGDLGTGFVQAENGAINVQADPDLKLTYLAGGNAYSGKIQIKSTNTDKVLAEMNAINMYDTLGRYIGTAMNCLLPNLA